MCPPEVATLNCIRLILPPVALFKTLLPVTECSNMKAEQDIYTVGGGIYEPQKLQLFSLAPDRKHGIKHTIVY